MFYVMVELSDGRRGLLSVKDRTHWKTKRTAQKHAKEYAKRWGLGAVVEKE